MEFKKVSKFNMAIRFLIFFFVSALAQDYVSITDPAEFIDIDNYSAAAYPVLQADDARFTRYSVNNEFSIAAWVLLDDGITSQTGAMEILLNQVVADQKFKMKF